MQKRHGSDPATRHYIVTPSNTDPQTPAPRALYAANSGTIVITDDANTTISYTVTAGTILRFTPTLIRTDTTANTIAWY